MNIILSRFTDERGLMYAVICGATPAIPETSDRAHAVAAFRSVIGKQLDKPRATIYNGDTREEVELTVSRGTALGRNPWTVEVPQ